MRFRFALLGLMVAANACADSWVRAEVRVAASAGGQYLVRVTPGESWGDTIGFAGSKKGKYAEAEWFEYREGAYVKTQAVTLKNPVAPVEVMVAGNGAVLTLDNWHNAGYGQVAVIYDRDGKLVKAYTLDTLYTAVQVARISTSVSSRWWRCDREGSRLQVGEQFFVDDRFGGRFSFNAATGAMNYAAGDGDQRCADKSR